MKFYKVQTGFGENDYRQIDETELDACLRAQITGKVALTSDGSISGAIIQQIIPDWNRVMGFRRGYKLTGEDYEAIGENRVKEYRIALAEAKLDVQAQIEGRPRVSQIGSGAAALAGSKELAAKMKVK